MKKSNIFVKLVLFIVIVGILGGGGYYYFFLREEASENGSIFPSLSSNKIEDSKNGIYVIKNKIKQARTMLKSCYVDSISDYLVVINDDYMLYHGNCLNMVFVSDGKTDKLKFEKKNDSKYIVYLDDKAYIKDDSVTNLVVSNNVLSSLGKVNYDSLKYVIDNSEYPGYYYSFSGTINSKYNFSYNYVYDKNSNSFKFSIANEAVNYQKNMKTFNDLPEFYILNDNIVILDNNKVGNDYKGEIYIYSNEKLTFKYDSILPININGNNIDSSWNRIFRYDSSAKTLYVLFSRTSDVCDFSNSNYFYEFKLNYDYKKIGFGTPDLYKKGSTDKDCKYAKKYYLKEY